MYREVTLGKTLELTFLIITLNGLTVILFIVLGGTLIVNYKNKDEIVKYIFSPQFGAEKRIENS